MKDIIINHKGQFEEFMNVELFEKVIKLGEQDETAILQFSQEHQIEYVGELAQRWTERKIVNSEKDLIALTLGLASFSYSNKQFMYDQREIFVSNVTNYLNETHSSTPYIALLYFMENGNINVDEMIHRIHDLPKTNNKFEHIFNIYLLEAVYRSKADETLFALICNYIDEVQLNLNNPFQDYVQLLLLTRTYFSLDKPKAKSFKTKGMSRLLQTIANLRFKEIDWNEAHTPAMVLGVSKEDVITYNYILVTRYRWGYYDKITEPGYLRIHENFLRAHYESSNTITKEFTEEIENNSYFSAEVRKNYYQSFAPFRDVLRKSVKNITNKDNLKHLINHVPEDVFYKEINRDYIDFIKDGLIEDTKITRVIGNLLNRQLNEEDFKYLETMREKYEIDIKEPSQKYIDNRINYGYLDIYDIDLLEKESITGLVVNFVKREKKVTDYFLFLEKISPEYYSNIDKMQNELEEWDKDTQKLFYRLKLKSVFHNNPVNYPDVLFGLLENQNFINLFEYTPDEIEVIERKLYDNKLLSDKNHKSLHKKLTPKEVLEAEYIKKSKALIISKMKEQFCYMYIDGAIEICTKYPTLINTLVESVLDIQIKKSLGTQLDDYLVMIYKMRAYLQLTQEQIIALENKALDTLIKLEKKSA